MKTYRSLTPLNANVGLIKDGNGVTGVSILLGRKRDIAQLLCALNEILEFDQDSVKLHGTVGLLSAADVRVRKEVLDRWRTKVGASSGHIGYLRLTEDTLSEGAHRLDIASNLS